MGFLKSVVLLIIAAVLVVLGMGNMAPVDLHLVPQGVVPEEVTGTDLTLKQIPLALVIAIAFLMGLVVGEILEWARETKHRRAANDRGREVNKLRTELSKVKEQVSDPDDDLPKIPVR